MTKLAARGAIYGGLVALSLLGCAAAGRVAPTNPQHALAATVLSISSTAPPRADLVHRPAMLRFVDDDKTAAVRLTNGLLDTAELFDAARCTQGNPTDIQHLLTETRSYVLYLVLFSLAHEFDLEPTIPKDRGPNQTMAILTALDERLDTSEVLFPTIELLTPEDAAVMVGHQDTAQLSTFPTYIELLHWMSRTKADLDNKKSRIAAKVKTLRDAVSYLYLRSGEPEQERLCEAVAALADATHDALSWAIADVRHGGGSSAAVYEFVLEVALTNQDLDATVAVSPWATARVELDNGSFAKLDVADRRLDSETAIDNTIPPGFTVVRSFAGITQRGIVRGCEVEVEILGAAAAAHSPADAAQLPAIEPGPMTITIGICDESE